MMKKNKIKWYQSLFFKDPEKEFMKIDKKMPENIYGGKNYSEYQKKFHLIHYVFKYKFLVPLIMLSKRILDKHLVKKVPKGSHNTNLRIFNKAYDKALEEWIMYYLRNYGEAETRASRKKCKENVKNSPYLPTLKHIVNTLYIHDTAYREFINILMHNIAKHMVEHYSKYPGKKTGHLLFTTDIYDVNYYILEKKLRYSIDLSIENAEELISEFESKLNPEVNDD